MMALSLEEAHAEAIQHLASIDPEECCFDALAALCHAVLEEYDFVISSDVTATARNARKAQDKLKARIDNLRKEVSKLDSGGASMNEER